jgi:hypothetical protein
MSVRAAARVVLSAGAALWLAACSGSAGLLEVLDERAGVVLLRAREPLVFARTEPRYSRSLRDYLYVGPVETNRRGVREYYLWVGVASTLDRGFIAPAADIPKQLYVSVEGEPMELTLVPWRELVRTTITGPLYATSVPLEAELAARVTLQQLTLLDGALRSSVAVSADAELGRNYRRWESKATFDDFLTVVAER